jgi:hypothetical protein
MWAWRAHPVAVRVPPGVVEGEGKPAEEAEVQRQRRNQPDVSRAVVEDRDCRDTWRERAGARTTGGRALITDRETKQTNKTYERTNERTNKQTNK